MKQIVAVVFLVFSAFVISAEEYFRIELEEFQVAGVPALHSGVAVVYQGKWILIGGRTNGLHGFLPISAFPNNGRNENVYLVDIASEQTLSAPLNNLPQKTFEGLTSSNMQFALRDSILYVTGGYGWNDSAQNFITYRTLTAINLNGLVDALENNESIEPHFRQLEDERMAICGAHMKIMDDYFYLVFGHLFDGVYKREDSTGFFVQQYSHEIRKFKIDDNGISLNISDYSVTNDTTNFRRRDYNLVHQIFPDRSEGFTAFTGVFRKGIDLPHFNTVDIWADSFRVNNNFNQNLSQYHSAVLPVYDSLHNHMHTIFFGGMGMYYRDTVSNTIATDSLIPFVRTISKITRDSVGNMSEYELDISFPEFLGTNAEFMLLPGIDDFNKGIIHLNPLQERTQVGYIYGGIESPEPNLSNTDPAESFATYRIFKVFINKNPPDTTVTKTSFPVIEPVKLEIFPNPFSDLSSLRVLNYQERNMQIVLLDNRGKFLKQIYSGKEKTLEQTLNLKEFPQGMYHIQIRAGNYKKVYSVLRQ